MSDPNEVRGTAGDIARALDDAGIPNILWGYAALGLVGQVKVSNDIDFVVSDELVQKATDILIVKGYELCTSRKCPWGDERKRARALAAAHFDIVPDKKNLGPVQIFPKSHILWWLKKIPAGDPSPDDEDLLLTNDPRLPPKLKTRSASSPIERDLYGNYTEEVGPSGPWEKIYPMKILKPESFTEALILLYCRDYHNPNIGDGLQLGYDKYWKRLLLPMGEVKVDPKAIVPKTLRPEFREAWANFNLVEQPYFWEFFHDDLCAKLKKQNKLPSFPGIFRLYQ